jgi:molybdopterin synthase catalytic subunit
MKHNFINTNGVSWGLKHIVTAEDLTDVDAVVEVIELEITSAPTVAEDISVVIRGAEAVVIAVLDTDDEEGVATKIADGTFTGWKLTSDGAVVTFTATVAGAKTGTNSVDFGTTEATGTIEVETVGADAIPAKIEFETPELNGNFACIASFTENTGALVTFTGTIKVIQTVATGKAIVEIIDNVTPSLSEGDIITLMGNVVYA